MNRQLLHTRLADATHILPSPRQTDPNKRTDNSSSGGGGGGNRLITTDINSDNSNSSSTDDDDSNNTKNTNMKRMPLVYSNQPHSNHPVSRRKHSLGEIPLPLSSEYLAGQLVGSSSSSSSSSNSNTRAVTMSETAAAVLVGSDAASTRPAGPAGGAVNQAKVPQRIPPGGSQGGPAGSEYLTEFLDDLESGLFNFLLEPPNTTANPPTNL
jgi:hypothetical protein